MSSVIVRIYPWDNADTILHRVARHLKTRPRFVLLENVPQVPKETTESEIRFRNVLDELSSDLDPELRLAGLWETGALDEDTWDRLARGFGDMTLQQFLQKMEVQKTLDEREMKKMMKLEETFEALEKVETVPHFGWRVGKHRVRYTIQDDRVLGAFFDQIKMSGNWLLAVLISKYYSWGERTTILGKIQRGYDPRVRELWSDGALMDDLREEDESIFLYHQDMDAPVTVRQHTDRDKIEIEIEFSESIDVMKDVLRFFDIEEGRIVSRTDVGMTGSFSFREITIEYPIFQDACMNDPVISSFLMINESKRATYEMGLSVVFRPLMREILEISKNQTTYADLTVRNLHRQTGYLLGVNLNTPVSEERAPLFFTLMERLLGYYTTHRSRWIEEYTRFFPDLPARFEKQKRDIVTNIKGDRPEYFVKYPRMFIKNLYSVKCQKNLQPVLVEEDEVGELPKEKVIRFPPEPVEEIQPEYYYCPNPDYPHAGLKELKGDVINMAPCCFNSPQDKENERKLRLLRIRAGVEEDEEATARRIKKDNVISGKFLIKHPGQLGTIRPPTMTRFLLAIDPSWRYFRCGIEQSPSSLLSCMLTRRKYLNIDEDVIEIPALRKRIADDEHCAPACLQENPGSTIDEIRRDLENPNVYFDPRRFSRAIELFFGVQLVVFSKPPAMLEEDATLQYPLSMRSHYSRKTNLPVVVIFEHWGGKTNILSRHAHPHCELVVYKTLEGVKTDFSDTAGVFNVLRSARFQFDGETMILPFDASRCWFQRHITGQAVDPIGKVRRIQLEIGSSVATATVHPPLSILDDIPFTPEIHEIDALDALPFLARFDSWVGVHVPDPDKNLVYWTVRQNGVFSSTLDRAEPVLLTFAVRLPGPPPLDGVESVPIVRVGGEIDPRSLLLVSTRRRAPSSVREEKIARCLLDLSIFAFSIFLARHKLRPEGIDPDVVLDSFFKEAIRIDTSHDYPESIQYDDPSVFFVRERLVLPSKDFWRRVRYNLKWILFHHPAEFSEARRALPSFYRHVSDFSEDAASYIFHLESLGIIFKDSVEERLPVLSTSLESIPDTPRRALWYNTRQSPAPYPLWMKTHPDEQSWRRDAEAWYGSEVLVVYDWSDTQSKWIPRGDLAREDNHRVYIARSGEKLVLLCEHRN